MTPVEAKVRAVVNYPDDMPDGSRSPPLCEREASGVIELKGGGHSHRMELSLTSAFAPMPPKISMS